MRTTFKHLPASYFGSLILIVALASCSGYQSTSYYPSDGIYGGEVVSRTKTAPVENSKDINNSKEVYYKDYFSNIADDYASLDNPQQYVFTDTDNYSSNRGNANVQVNSQAPWGDQTSRTEIYYINNNPWGYFNNGWGFNNSFFDPFWGYRPFYGGFYNRPFGDLVFIIPTAGTVINILATLSTTVFVLTEAFITTATTEAMLGLGIQEDRLETTIITTPEVVVPFKIVPELAVQEPTVIIIPASTTHQVKTVTMWEEGFRAQQIRTDQMSPLDKVVPLDPTKSQIIGAPHNPVLVLLQQ